MARQPKRYTIYDRMEEKGYFDSNPANIDSRGTEGQPLYTGPVEFPRILYHPEGAERITVPAEIIATALGPKAVGEQRELIWRQVNNEAEMATAVAAGWHLTPRAAMAASGAGKLAPASPADTIAELQARIAAMQVEMSQLEAGKLQAQRAELAANKPAGAVAVARRTTPAAGADATS